jgi:uncharacterized protein
MKHRFFRKTLRTLILSAIAIVSVLSACLFYANKIEPNWIEIVYVPVEIPQLAPEFDGYQIAQLSDIHADLWMTEERLQHIVGLVNHLQPDAIALTGDFVTYDADIYAASLTATLQQLAPKDATVAVLGNHDQWSSPEVIRQVLRQSNITDVSNGVLTLRRQNAMLHLAGVDDIWTHNDRLDLVLEKLPSEGTAILLVHEPDFADTSAATGRFALQLSGHSHGGQVALPLIGTPKLPQYGEKYPAGRYQVGNMIQYTNRGVGMARPRVRFNCRPEITVLVLQSKPELAVAANGPAST